MGALYLLLIRNEANVGTFCFSGLIYLGKPLVEQIIVPHKDKEKIVTEDKPSTVFLDLLPDHTNPLGTGIYFQQVNWKSYLNSLKPLGLNFLLQTNILTAIMLNTSISNENTLAGLVNFLRDTSCSASVQQESLADVSKEIGFVNDDAHVFTLRHRFHLLSRELNEKGDQSITSLPQRYALKTNLTATIVEDLRNKKLQLFCEGHPKLILEKVNSSLFIIFIQHVDLLKV